MSDFLLELRSEEIPARMQKGARGELEKLFRREMAAAGVSFGDLTIWSTPRRLALIASDMPTQTEAVSEEAKGPPEAAPDQAVDGFCRKNGITRDQLEVREVKGRATYFAVIDTPGRAVAEVLAEAIPAIIRDFSWPKSQRWGAASISTESLRWVRPLSGIVALLGGDIITCEVHGIASGDVTKGHRFHHSGDISFGGADEYAAKLRAAHVIVDHTEREAIIRDGAKKAASDAGLDLVEDEGLVVENAGLTEWPVPLLGRFEDDFLEVPPETIQLTARVNQKYFVCEKDGKLANAFICTANIAADDGGAAIVDGNRKVLAARLSDARFFWDVDRKKTLAQHAEGLGRITFHEKLGTVAGRASRVGSILDVLWRAAGVEETDSETLKKLALMAKADLVTEMVGEFPELQGLMGYYYGKAEGLPDSAAEALRDQYKPTGPDDEIPTSTTGISLALADKIEALTSFFAVDLKPTGSKDPFALRRAALGVIRIILETGLRLPLKDIFGLAAMDLALQKFDSVIEFIEKNYSEIPDFMNEINFSNDEGLLKYKGFTTEIPSELRADFRLVEELKSEKNLKALEHALFTFVVDRLKVQQREAGVRHDLIDAVFALGDENDLVRLLARVHALQSFMATDDGTNLLAGYKRASNILKKENHLVTPAKAGDQSGLDDENALDSRLRGNDEGGAAEPLTYTPEAAEKALVDALDAAGPQAASAIETEDFAAAMTSLSSLRAPIDRFFEEVTVNDDDPAKREARLGLLARFRDAVHQVADFSKIEG